MSYRKIEEDINWSKLDGMLMFDASESVCADELAISPDTLERRIKKKFNLTFGEYKKKQLGRTVLRLKQKMIKKALEGDNTCLIFTLKNISDWKDKHDVENTGQQTIVLSKQDQDKLLDLSKKARQEKIKEENKAEEA